MATYIALLNWTDQGIRAYKDTPKRADAFAAAVQKLGAKLVKIYWTVGPYDLVCIIEAPDDETVAKHVLTVAAGGNLRTITLKARSSPFCSPLMSASSSP